MITIQRNLRRDGYYSEWMRTKNGELAAVSVMARETRDKPLYAYAYAHSVLTFFRLYDTDNAAKMSKKQFTETILEHVKYAYQKRAERCSRYSAATAYSRWCIPG